jgi:putative MATE family efflux protein
MTSPSSEDPTTPPANAAKTVAAGIVPAEAEAAAIESAGIGGLDEPLDPVLALSEQEASTEAQGQIRSGRLAGRSLAGAIAILAGPVLLQQALTAVVGLVDKIISGSLPAGIVKPAMDAIGIGSFVGWFIAVAMGGLGMGGQAIVARAMGAGDRVLAERAAGGLLGLGLAWGAIVGIAMWLLVSPLAKVTGLSPDAATFCGQYVQVMAVSMPFCAVMMVGSMALHGAGDTIRPSVIAVAVNLVNLAASIALSGVELRVGEGRLPALLPIDPGTYGVLGIAGGTAVAYLVGGIATAMVLLRGVRDLRVRPHSLRPSRSIAWRIVRLGIPNFFEGLAMWGVNLFVLAFIGLIALAEASDGVPREGLVGAHTIAVQWEAFSFLPGFAMGTAAAALAGQYLGAGNPAMARRAIVACTVVAMAFMGVLGIVFMLFGRFLTGIISDDPLHLEIVPKLLLIAGGVQVFFALIMVVRQALRGVGDAKAVLAITVLSSYGIRLPLAWLLGVQLGHGLVGIWIGLCGELAIRGSLFAARFLQGGWAKIRV